MTTRIALLLLSASIAAPAAWADDTATTAATTTPPETSTTPPPAEKKIHNEISFRGRMLGLPRSILDIWYFNADDEGWALPGEDRPKITGYALGLEYCVKGPAANGIFYFDYMDSTMKAGYWDDLEEPPDHLDGSYIVPSKSFGLIAFGADFGYEAHLVRTAQTNGNFGLSLMPGAGLGLAVRNGSMDEWTPDDPGEGNDPSYVNFQNGEDPDKQVRIPKVLPMVDINLALRFNFGDRAVLRLEGGFHDVMYYGATIGLMF
jgi:hypothetical protein